MKKSPLRKFAMKDFSDAIEIYLRTVEEQQLFRSITLFPSPLTDVRQRIRVTKIEGNAFRVTFGRPNYEERDYLKQCKKAKCNPRRIWYHYRSKKK